jgi:molybdopterin-guanine dinucleotide biosynthesis protein
MKTVVVCGHSRKVGKTSVTAGLIEALSKHPWTAIKISTHWHAGSPVTGVCSIHEEKSREGLSDSSRFLAAGAARSFWIRVRKENAGEAMPQLLSLVQSSPFLMIESNWILRHIQPDINIMVLRYDVEDFKDSARKILARADAVVAVNKGTFLPSWNDFAREAMAGIPEFEMADPHIIPPALVKLVKTKID